MRRNPRDWRIDDLETLARRFGLHVRKSGGSHAVFYDSATGHAITVPARRPIKPIYIKMFLALIDETGGQNHETEI